jgi:hypothetical protein
MNTPKIIEQCSRRVLTTTQLADAYGADKQIIINNFNRNKDRYKQDKHFIALEGQEKQEFINQHQIDLGSKNAKVLYLWTEKGAWLHAKSLNTDEAWDAYEMLVDSYYEMKKSIDTSALSPELQMFNKIFNSLATQELENKKIQTEMKQTRSEVQGIREIVALNPREWRKEVNTILNKIALKQGGYEQFSNIKNESYDLLELRANAKLKIRLVNKKKKMALEGVAKSRVNKVSNLDVIDEDKRLLEIYLSVVKEMAIKYGIDFEETNRKGG